MKGIMRLGPVMLPFFDVKSDIWAREGQMAEVNLKRLSRAELLEMMINFSEEAEAAKKHEQEYREELEREKLAMQQQMAEERAAMLKSFDDEKAEMRAKFNEQKAQMQAKFDKDIAGLKARLTREKNELQLQVDDSLSKIENSGNLAEASLMIGGILESAQKAADLYVKSLQDKARAEYEDFQNDLANARRQLIPTAAPKEEVKAEPEAEVETVEEKPKEKAKKATTKKSTTKKTTTKKTTTGKSAKTEDKEDKKETTRARRKKEETSETDE